MKVLLVGAGRIGKRHAEHINRLGELMAVCDTDQESGESVSDLYNVPYFSSIDELLGAKIKADVVAVCTPNGFHAEHSILSLKAGYHVLCEKPMALSVHDCGEMIKTAEQANKRLFIVKQNRYNPPVAALKKIIAENGLGKDSFRSPYLVFGIETLIIIKNTWKGTKDLDGGILYTQFSHFIDLLYWLIGDISKVKAYSKNVTKRTDIEFEDTSVVACEFYNGAIGTMNFSINAYNKNMEGSLNPIR